MMQFLWIGWQTLILTGTIIFTYGAEEKDSITSSTTSPDYNPNDDYPDNYPDYHDRDYPNPDYYDQTPNREGRSFAEDAPDSMNEENYLKQLRSTIPGIPGVDYPLYQSVPDTSFQCQDQRNPGFYGDVEAQCQVFHICQEDDRHDSFLCPVGTVFNQMNFICDWWFNFKCELTPNFFHLNSQYYTSTGATPASVMIRETMKKMRRFTEGTKHKASAMKNSMRDADTGFYYEMKRRLMNKQQFMAEMERQRIMNLFMPKMRPADFWKKLRATTSTDKQQTNQDIVDVPPTSATAALKNEDLKLLPSTKHLDYVNSDYPTTSEGTTEESHHETTSTNYNIETTSQSVSNTIQSNHTESPFVFHTTSNSIPMSNEIETGSMEQNGVSTRSDFEENGMNMSITVPTATLDVHSISKNISFDSIPIEVTEEEFNDIMALIDLNIENSTDTLTPLTDEYITNQTYMLTGEISGANNLLSESPINSTDLPMSSPNTELNIALYPPFKNLSSATLGNGTHVSVSVTIRARTGISRLKWRRVGQGKKRKNLNLENAPANADVDMHRYSFMDVEYRKRPMRNKKFRSRIMWIPTKNSSLSRKSHWRIFLNSQPQNFSTNNFRKEKGPITKSQLTEDDVKLPIKIQEKELEKEQMTKAELTGHVKSPIHIQNTELEKTNSLELNMVQLPKSELTTTDTTSETLMTESTKLSFALLATSESTTSNSNEIVFVNSSVSTVNDDKEDHSMKSHENIMEFDENTNCEAICIKFLKSLGLGNYSKTDKDITPTATISESYMSTTDAVNNEIFGRRSFLEISPSDQWTVKHDPDPDCDEDEHDNKVLVRGWSVIIDSGSVTKEKTVKRRSCLNAVDDNKIFVMQNMLPDHETTPVENAPNVYGHGTSNQPNISFGSTDQQYWFTLVKNWLESSPKSKNSAGSNARWKDDSNISENQGRALNTEGHFPSTNANWMEINPSKSEAWPPAQRAPSRNQNYNENSRKQYFGGQKKIKDSIDGSNNKVKHDWSENINYKNNGQVEKKQNPNNSGNLGHSSRLKSFPDTRTRWNANGGWQQDVSSSQSDRREWHINVGGKNKKNVKPRYEIRNFDNGKQSWSNGNDQRNTKSQNLPQSFSKGDDNNFKPRGGNQDWSSSETQNAFSGGRNKKWSENRRNQMHGSRKTKRAQDEWFMSSEENMRISPPQSDGPIWKDDRSDWDSDQSRKGAPVSKNGFSDDRNDQRPWSSDSSNKPWSSTKMQMDEDFDSRRKGSWSSDEDVKRNKKFGSSPKGGSWNSGSSSKNGGFPSSSRGRSWSSDDRDSKRDETRNGFPDANIKPDWSPNPQDSKEDWPSTKGRSKNGRSQFDKPDRSNRQSPENWPSDGNRPIPSVREDWPSNSRDSQEDWPSTKGRSTNGRSQFDKPDRSNRQNPEDWPSDSNRSVRNGRAWDMDDRDSNFPSKGNKNGRPSSRRMNKGSWTSDDQQTKADWSSNKGDWSDRRKENPSDSRNGIKSPTIDNKRRTDSSWAPSSDRSDWPRDSQRDISDWSEDDRQSRNEDWSSKGKGDMPSFNRDKTSGRDFKASESRNFKEDWPSDDRRDNRDWSSESVDKRGRSDEQKPISWSPDDSQVIDDEPDSQSDWSFDDQKDISDDDRISKDRQDKTKNKSSRGSSWGNKDSAKSGFGNKPGWDSKGSISNQKPSSIKGNKPASSQGQNGWNNPQTQTGGWKMDLPKAASDWASSIPDNKRASTKTNGKGRPISQDRWVDDDIPSRTTNTPIRMDEDWSWDAPPKSGSKAGLSPDIDSPSSSVSWDSSEEDWPSENAGKSAWSSDEGQNRRSSKKGSDSSWNQDPPSQTNIKTQNPSRTWNTKGRTKTAMVMPSTSKDNPGMMPRKPWKDDSDQPITTKNIKGDPAVKEEKIVWSVQISSNGETGNGWVPITLRPELRKQINQTRDQNSNKGTPMGDGGWTGLEQKSATWDSDGQDKIPEPPQLKTDMITESIPSSTQMIDSSDSHPFYIPVSNVRFKREAKPFLRIRHHVRPRDNSRTIYRVIKNGIELKNNQTNNESRFYFASANILVGDNHSSKKQSNSFANRHRSKLDIIGKREYNETIKNTVPSLIQLRNLKQVNITAKNAKRFKSNQDWDSLMQESEAKESWSAPIDDSNVPSSGWIPLFRVVKVPNRDPTKPNQNTSHSEEKNTEIKRIINGESTVYIVPKSQQSNSSNFRVPNETVIKNVTIELPKPSRTDELSRHSRIQELAKHSRTQDLPKDSRTQEFPKDLRTQELPMHSRLQELPKHLRTQDSKEFKNFHVKNITVDEEMPVKNVDFEHEMKVGNQTLRIIPFSDIMKQLRMKPTELSSMYTTTSTVSSTTTEDDWNIPITTSPKTYAIKLVDDSEMKNHTLPNSWTFTRRTPEGREAWILIKENKTMPTENRSSSNRSQKVTENNDGFIRIPYKIIVGNRTVQPEESSRVSERKLTENNTRNRPINSPNPPSKEFSFDLKNWQKDSDWTPLLRGVGSVKPKPSANKSIGDG